MLKRIFDIFFSFTILVFTIYLMLVFLLIAALDTKTNGIFSQKRIGKKGVPFTIYKFRTINPITETISPFGKFLRKYKIDEVPQLVNVLFGDMSFVGPRPDIEGYYDKLEGENRKILELKPGITSLASIKYSNEEDILKTVDNPTEYNDRFIFPDKVKMNLDYYYNKSLRLDIKIIFLTIAKVISSIVNKES